MANRLPEVAAKAMDGHGLMVCGLSEGKRIGVRKTEDHELENALHPFLGASGPLWTTHRLPSDNRDKELLVIIVDAPSNGDPVFACLKESEGVTDGGIYIRSKTQTRPVRGQEHHALVSRLLAGNKKPELDISVELVTPLHAVRWGADLLDTYLKESESLLLGSLPTSEVSPVQTLNQSLTKSLVGPTMVAEKRSQAEFTQEVEKWKTAGRKCVDDVAKLYVSMALPGAVFKITNKTETYLKDIELRIHLEGAVETALLDDSRKLRLNEVVPRRPREYGPYTIPFGAMLPSFSVGSQGFLGPNWESSFQNSGSVDAVFAESALRPKSTIYTDSNDSILFLPDGNSGDVIEGSWTLTAEGIDAVVEGRIRIVVPQLLELVPGMFGDVVIDVRQDFR